MTDILSRNPVLAEAYAEQVARAAHRATTHAEVLAWIGRADGDVCINFYKVDPAPQFAESTARNPAFLRTMELFSGSHAIERAIRDAEVERGEPRSDYLTTIVLEPSGHWREVYLFRL